MPKSANYVEGGHHPSTYRDKGEKPAPVFHNGKPAPKPCGRQRGLEKWPKRMVLSVTALHFKKGYAFLMTEQRKRVYMPLAVFGRTLSLKSNRIVVGHIIDCDVDLDDRSRGLRVTQVYGMTTPIE